ncbi:MAG: glycosyltransferase [Bacteroidales bacterium]|nr:glycosyltransferase [Bacteroidales bacterium]
MKVVIVGPAHPFRGGIAAFSQRLAAAFKAAGDDVEMVTFTLQYPSFLFPGKTQFSSDPAPEGIGITRILSSVNPFTWIATARQIRKMHPDIVIFAYWMSFFSPAYWAIARALHASPTSRNSASPTSRNSVPPTSRNSASAPRIVALIHNLIPHEPKFWDRPLAKLFLKKTDLCLALSESVCNQVRTLCPGKETVHIPHPVYDIYGEKVPRAEACAHLGLNPEDRHLLFFGLIREHKGLALLLDAYAGLTANPPPDSTLTPSSTPGRARLIVAGEFYGNGDKYHSLAREKGIDDRVIWRSDFIPDSEVKYYFSAADLVVLPYKSATQSGVSSIALQFEVPVLVTDTGSLPEAVRDGSGILTSPDAVSIRQALSEFLSSAPDFSRAISARKAECLWDTLATRIRQSHPSSQPTPAIPPVKPANSGNPTRQINNNTI